MRLNSSFTLVEILIAVLILAIVAMLVVPRFASSSQDARDAALATDLKALRRQIELYKVQHDGGKGPEVNELGQYDLGNFVNRVTQRTTPSGALDSAGSCGPYLSEWPANPFCDSDVAKSIKFGKPETPPRDGTSGWYYSIFSRQIHVNSQQGAESVD
ncbi:MAG: type II secretion system protein [Planctomycetota bacterium]